MYLHPPHVSPIYSCDPPLTEKPRQKKFRYLLHHLSGFPHHPKDSWHRWFRGGKVGFGSRHVGVSCQSQRLPPGRGGEAWQRKAAPGWAKTLGRGGTQTPPKGRSAAAPHNLVTSTKPYLSVWALWGTTGSTLWHSANGGNSALQIQCPKGVGQFYCARVVQGLVTRTLSDSPGPLKMLNPHMLKLKFYFYEVYAEERLP